MNKISQKRELAYIRQLCCLGLGMPAILPDLQKAFHRILDHAVNCYTWLDENAVPYQGRMDVCMQEHMELFFNEFHNLLKTYDADLPEVRIPVFARRGKDTGNLMHASRKFYNTDFYNVLLRPFRLHKLLDGVVKVDRRPVGMVCFFRGPSDPPYTSKQQEIVRLLLPYLAYAEQTEPDLENVEYCNTNSSGIVVAKSDGSISHISKGAREILYWALLENAPQGSIRRDWSALLREQVKYLCRILADVFSSKDASLPPIFKQRGRYGELVYRAYWLDGFKVPDENLVVIYVDWKKPKQLIALENAKKLNLTVKQSELCMYLASGFHKDDICNSLGVKYNTYKDYLSDIYLRLEVNSRESLLQQLLQPTNIGEPYSVYW